MSTNPLLILQFPNTVDYSKGQATVNIWANDAVPDSYGLIKVSNFKNLDGNNIELTFALEKEESQAIFKFEIEAMNKLKNLQEAAQKVVDNEANDAATLALDDAVSKLVALFEKYAADDNSDDPRTAAVALANGATITVTGVSYLPPKQGTDWTTPTAGQPGVTAVRIVGSTAGPTTDIALWTLIKLNAESLSWDNYQRALDIVFDCDSDDASPFVQGARQLSRRRFLPFTDTDSYRALKVATEAFFLSHSYALQSRKEQARALQAAGDVLKPRLDRLGVATDPTNIQKLANYLRAHLNGRSGNTLFPYLAQVARNLEGTTFGDRAATMIGQFKARRGRSEMKGVLATESGRYQESRSAIWQSDEDCCQVLDCWEQDRGEKLRRPFTHELIYVYWCEEALLMQTMAAIVRRFQNVRSPGTRDPLAEFAVDPLRSLSSVLFGFAQDEQHRLTVARRAYEYSHQYGLVLFGQAVPQLRPADHRSKFIEAFHTLLNLCVHLFRQADDTTVVPDGFPVLNALREVHILLSEGAHNQFGDLPATARVETLMQQWILARPELREFLPRRVMVNLPEPWMSSVESMRRLQGWGDGSVLHFWQLATFGEQIVSSIRWGNWSEVIEPAQATNWALFFRSEIQTYMHAYRATTGVDLVAEPVDAQVPGIHLLRRQLQMRRRLAA